MADDDNLIIETPDDEGQSSGRVVIDTPTKPTRPQPVTLICVRCEEEWSHPHSCDVIAGETLLRVIHED